MDALLSVLFISFPTDAQKGTYCILNDMPFCTLSFLFYLCRVNIKKLKWNVIQSFYPLPAPIVREAQVFKQT